MITNEGREELRAELNHGEPMVVSNALRLLDALDEAEARAEKAERERNALIDFLTDAHARAKYTRCRVGCIPKAECVKCWFAWAAQETAKEKKDER